MGKILLSLILSTDELGIGFSLGVRGIKIAKRIYTAIFFVVFAMLETAIFIGEKLVKILPANFAVNIGALSLIFVGIVILAQKAYESSKKANTEDCRRWDMDNSGSIEIFESVLLAAALSADAFGAGIGMGAVCPHEKILPFIMAVFQITFLYGGCIAGRRIKNKTGNFPVPEFLSGLILVLMGVIELKTGGILI